MRLKAFTVAGGLIAASCALAGPQENVELAMIRLVDAQLEKGSTAYYRQLAVRRSPAGVEPAQYLLCGEVAVSLDGKLSDWHRFISVLSEQRAYVDRASNTPRQTATFNSAWTTMCNPATAVTTDVTRSAG